MVTALHQPKVMKAQLRIVVLQNFRHEFAVFVHRGVMDCNGIHVNADNNLQFFTNLLLHTVNGVVHRHNILISRYFRMCRGNDPPRAVVVNN